MISSVSGSWSPVLDLFPDKWIMFGHVASKQYLKAVSLKSLSLEILPSPSFLPSDLGDCGWLSTPYLHLSSA